jgi:hypothetical protein
MKINKILVIVIGVLFVTMGSFLAWVPSDLLWDSLGAFLIVLGCIVILTGVIKLFRGREKPESVAHPVISFLSMVTGVIFEIPGGIFLGASTHTYGYPQYHDIFRGVFFIVLGGILIAFGLINLLYKMLKSV